MNMNYKLNLFLSRASAMDRPANYAAEKQAELAHCGLNRSGHFRLIAKPGLPSAKLNIQCSPRQKGLRRTKKAYAKTNFSD
jgi:hypothetical protein